MRTVAFSIVALSLLAAGCGGGKSAGQTDGPLQTTTVGTATVGYVGKVSPHIQVASNAVSVAGLSGALFSYIDFYPTPTLTNTQLAYVRGGNIWTYSFATQKAKQITHRLAAPFAGARHPSWGQNGQIVFQDDSTGLRHIAIMNSDGSQITPIVGASVVTQTPCWSTDGVHIAGLDHNGTFVVMNANGTNVVPLDAAVNLDSSFNDCWIDKSNLAYNKPAGGFEVLYRVSITSLISTSTSIGGSGLAPMNAVYQPDGSGVLLQADSPVKIYAVNLEAGIMTPQSPAAYSETFPSFAPDNSTIAFERQRIGVANDGVSGIYTSYVDEANSSLIVPDPVSGGPDPLTTATDIAWSPYLKYRRFIGSGGAFGASATGFLYGQLGDSFQSFLSFTATTPSTTVITPATATGTTAPLVFSVKADAITRIVYTNGYYLPAIIVSPTASKNFIASFSSTTGQVTTIAPFTVSADRAGATVKPTLNAGRLVYRAKFQGVYSGEGKNLAPAGATKVEIDPKTGDLVSFG